MQIKQIIVNTVWFGVIPKIAMLINMVLLPMITPYLSPFDYGIIGIINSYTGIFTLLSILGLNVHLSNSFYVYGIHFRKVWGRILTLILVSSAVFSVVFGILMIFALTEISGTIKMLTIICACIPILLNANVTLASHYYPLVCRPKPLVIRNLLASIVGIAITFSFIYYLRLGFVGWVAGSAVAACAGFLLFIPPLWLHERIRPVPALDLQRIFRWLKISLPIIPHSLGFILLGSSDRIIMQMLGVSVNDIGLYSNGYQMGDYVTLLTSAMIVAVAPRIQECYRSGNFVALRRLYLFCQIIAGFLIVMFSIWMPQIYQLLIRNTELQAACPLAVLICFANIAYPFYAFISTAAFIEERTLKVLWLVFLPGVINIVLNLVFIPIYGYKAAVFTTLVAYWSQLLIPYFVGYFKQMAVRLLGNLHLPLVMGGVFLLMVFFAYYASDFNVMIKVSLSFIGGLGIIFYMYRQKEI